MLEHAGAAPPRRRHSISPATACRRPRAAATRSGGWRRTCSRWPTRRTSSTSCSWVTAWARWSPPSSPPPAPQRVKKLILVDAPPAPGALPPDVVRRVARARWRRIRTPPSSSSGNSGRSWARGRKPQRRLLLSLRKLARNAAIELTEDSLDYDARRALRQYSGPKFAIVTLANDTPLSLHHAVPDIEYVGDRGHGPLDPARPARRVHRRAGKAAASLGRLLRWLPRGGAVWTRSIATDTRALPRHRLHGDARDGHLPRPRLHRRHGAAASRGVRPRRRRR